MEHDGPIVKIRSGGQFASTKPVDMWFGVELESAWYANLYIGTQEGSLPVCQTLRLTLSRVWDPFRDLATLAEHAATGNLPFSMEIDSEGPESVLTLRQVEDSDFAIFEIRSLCSSVIYFAAIVNARKMGLALGYALQVAIRDEKYADFWKDWGYGVSDDTPTERYFLGNAWLRDVKIELSDF